MTSAKVSTANTRPSAIESLSPGYFALVMATGIISIAAFFHGMTMVAKLLFWVNIVAYAILWALTISRLVHFPKSLLADLVSHKKGAAFLTVVAATNVLATQLGLLTASTSLTYAMWMLGIVLWVVLLYTFLAAVTVRKGIKPALADGINGGWLMLVVSTESIAVLGAALGHKLAVELAPDDGIPDDGIGVEDESFLLDHEPAFGLEVLGDGVIDAIVAQVHKTAAAFAHR